MITQKVIYTPEGPIYENHDKPFSTLRLMFVEAYTARELTWRLFLRDFSARYRQSVLGIAWAVVMPLITIGMFIVMNRSGILAIQEVSVPYPLYALIGLSIWSLFSVGLSACTSSLINAGNMVVKINFPKSALIFAAAGQGVIDFVVRIVMITLAFVYFSVTPSWVGLFIGLISLFPLFLLMIGIGFVLSLLAGVIRDVVNAQSIFLLALMVLTPVLFPVLDDSILAAANYWNPLNYLVNFPRDMIIQGHSELLLGFSWAALLSLGIFFLGWRIFFLAQAQIAERL